jgi:hypothetical protein
MSRLICCLCWTEGREVVGHRLGGAGLSLCRKHRAAHVKLAESKSPAVTVINLSPTSEELLRRDALRGGVTLGHYAKPADATLH